MKLVVVNGGPAAGMSPIEVIRRCRRSLANATVLWRTDPDLARDLLGDIGDDLAALEESLPPTPKDAAGPPSRAQAHRDNRHDKRYRAPLAA